jgi:hypothetical protein
MAVFNTLLLVLIVIVSGLGCSRTTPKELMLADFEADEELNQLYWSCHTLYSQSNDHATHGSKSLKMELYPADYPGLVLTPAVIDWQDYKELYFDVYNPLQQQVQVTVRIDDQKDYPEYGDRYNRGFVLQYGSNHINIPLVTLAASGNSRHLDLRHIYRLFIFTKRLPSKISLYVDSIKLSAEKI